MVWLVEFGAHFTSLANKGKKKVFKRTCFNFGRSARIDPRLSPGLDGALQIRNSLLARKPWSGRLWLLNVRVLIDGPSELVFDYAVPAGLEVVPGCRVRVPLRRKSATGTVLSIVAPEQMDFALRELEALIDPEPLITPVLLRAGRWIADYYGCGIETVIRSLLPGRRPSQA